MNFKSTQLIVWIAIAVLSYAIYDGLLGTPDGIVYEAFTKGYALTDVTMNTTDETGHISSTLRSPSLIHYVDSEVTVIEQPRVTVYADSGNWYFSSPVAEYTRLEDHLFFPEDVTIQSLGEQSIELQTSGMTVDLAAELATTEAVIKMRQPGIHMQGIGARIFLNTQIIEIMDNVYAEYQPRL